MLPKQNGEVIVVYGRFFFLGGFPTGQLPPSAEAEGTGALPPRKAGRRAAGEYGR